MRLPKNILRPIALLLAICLIWEPSAPAFAVGAIPKHSCLPGIIAPVIETQAVTPFLVAGYVRHSLGLSTRLDSFIRSWKTHAFSPTPFISADVVTILSAVVLIFGHHYHVDYLAWIGAAGLVTGLLATLPPAEDPSTPLHAENGQVAESSKALDALFNAAFDADPEVRQAARDALAHFNLTPDQRFSLWRKTLDLPHTPDRLAAINALSKIDSSEARDSVMEMVVDPHPDVRRAAHDALTHLDRTPDQKVSHWTKTLDSPDERERVMAVRALQKIGSPGAKGVLLRATADVDLDVRRAARSALADFDLSPDQRINIWKSVLYSNVPNERLDAVELLCELLALNRESPGVFHGLPFGRLMAALEIEINYHPAEQRALIQDSLIKAVNAYIGQGRFRPEFDPEQEYDRLAHLAPIVHDNLPLVLAAINNLKLDIDDFHELIHALPLNNPLARIVRMLGEDQRIVGGCRDVTEVVIGRGRFGNLMALIVRIAQDKGRGAPAQIGGLLEVLRAEKADKEHPLASWDEGRWDVFAGDIQGYYDAGFKIVTPGLFGYYVKHRDDDNALERLRTDLKAQFPVEIGWGSFYSLDDTFKTTYGFSRPDEIALLGRYVTPSNFSTRDYMSAYDGVEKALREKTPAVWRAEVPETLRTLYAVRGEGTQVLYRGSPEDESALQGLMRGIASLAEDMAAPEPLTVRNVVTRLKEDPLTLKRVVVSRLLQERTSERAFLQIPPAMVHERRQWLMEWHEILQDTYRQDYLPGWTAWLEGAIDNLDAQAVEPLLTDMGFNFTDLRTVDRFPKFNDDMVRMAAEGRFDKFSQAVQSHWLAQVPQADLRNNRLYASWLDQGWENFITDLNRRAGRIITEPECRQLRSAMEEARDRILADAPGLNAVRRRQLGSVLARRLDQLFAEDGNEAAEVNRLEEALSHFEEAGVSSSLGDEYYVGFFDDLLHLSAEFMGSGVCTWDDRPRQVAEGLKEGYHFGVLAFKDATGRILGASQVQVVKTPVTGIPAKDNQGYCALALTGINLAQEMTVDRELVVRSLLQAANLLSRQAGLQGAVIPFDPNIHSNQPDVKQILQTLARSGILEIRSMSSPVRLSRGSHPYSYQKAYLVRDVPEIALEPVAQQDIVDRREEQELHTEKRHMSFFDNLGNILHNGEFPREGAEALRVTVDNVLAAFPPLLMDDLRSQALRGMNFSISRNLALEHSQVSRSPDGAHVYLGRDVFWEQNEIEPLALREALAEAVASLLMTDLEYARLKEESSHNENAWFKLEITKGLLNYRERLALYHKLLHRYDWTPETAWHRLSPKEQKDLSAQYRSDLGRYTQGMDGIAQWNVFLSVMDDADPEFLVANYLQLLLNPLVGPETIAALIGQVLRLDVSRQPSIAHLRNIVKDFMKDGKARLRLGDAVVEKESFSHFDDAARLTEWEEPLTTTRDRAEFNATLDLWLAYVLPFSDKELKEERIVAQRLFNRTDRRAALRETLEELLVRRLGKTATETFKDHLSGNRGTRSIPYVEPLRTELNHGDDADQFELLRYLQQEEGKGYQLYSSSSEEVQDRDWVKRCLFPFDPEDDASDGSGPNSLLYILTRNRRLGILGMVGEMAGLVALAHALSIHFAGQGILPGGFIIPLAVAAMLVALIVYSLLHVIAERFGPNVSANGPPPAAIRSFRVHLFYFLPYALLSAAFSWPLAVFAATVNMIYDLPRMSTCSGKAAVESMDELRDIVHDLNNLLGHLSGRMEIAAMELGSPEYRPPPTISLAIFLKIRQDYKEYRKRVELPLTKKGGYPPLAEDIERFAQRFLRAINHAARRTSVFCHWVKPHDPDLARVLRTCASGARKLLTDFLDPDQRGETGTPELVNLRESVHAARQLMESKTLLFQSEFPPDSPVVRIDPGLMADVWTNLVTNAETAAGGEVTLLNIKCWITMGYVNIDVTDNGSGIRSDILPNIFVELFTTKPLDPEGHHGIGLHRVREIIEAAGGTVTVTSKVAGERAWSFDPANGAATPETPDRFSGDHGTTFHITLPEAEQSKPASPGTPPGIKLPPISGIIVGVLLLAASVIGAHFSHPASAQALPQLTAGGSVIPLILGAGIAFDNADARALLANLLKVVSSLRGQVRADQALEMLKEGSLSDKRVRAILRNPKLPPAAATTILAKVAEFKTEKALAEAQERERQQTRKESEEKSSPAGVEGSIPVSVQFPWLDSVIPPELRESSQDDFDNRLECSFFGHVKQKWLLDGVSDAQRAEMSPRLYAAFEETLRAYWGAINSLISLFESVFAEWQQGPLDIFLLAMAMQKRETEVLPLMAVLKQSTLQLAVHIADQDRFRDYALYESPDLGLCQFMAQVITIAAERRKVPAEIVNMKYVAAAKYPGQKRGMPPKADDQELSGAVPLHSFAVLTTLPHIAIDAASQQFFKGKWKIRVTGFEEYQSMLQPVLDELIAWIHSPDYPVARKAAVGRYRGERERLLRAA